VERPGPDNLVSFPRRDARHWRSASWRDSDAGYAGGRYAMDVNAIWVPRALEATAAILAALPDLGMSLAALDSLSPGVGDSPLADYARDTLSLRRAIETWRGARRHFEVTLAPPELAVRLRGALADLPAGERRYWQRVLARHREPDDSLSFLAIALDSAGKPIPVVNTDPATGLFLEDFTPGILTGRVKAESVLRDIRPFVRPYPVALFVPGLGPLVANDAYASDSVRGRFRRDAYHGPRVVWGREVNLLFLGLARQLAGGLDAAGRPADPSLGTYLEAVDDALRQALAAVQASGLEHNELWSYRIEGGRLRPTRYGTSSDIQLWNGTNLAVQFALSRLPRP
jgi:hypothetical protein